MRKHEDLLAFERKSGKFQSRSYWSGDDIGPRIVGFVRGIPSGVQTIEQHDSIDAVRVVLEYFIDGAIARAPCRERQVPNVRALVTTLSFERRLDGALERWPRVR